MKLRKEDIIVLCILFIAAFWLWTLPFQKNHLPFSEHDGAYIFSYGDHITFLGRTMNLVGDTPPSTNHWYAAYNKIFGPLGIVYPPPYNIDYSLMQIIGGERIVPVFIFIVFGSILGVFSMYFLMRKLFGFLPAVITGSALIFSLREILTYLWGQRHNTFAFVFIPVAIYAFYKMLSSYYKNDRKNYIAYLYIFILLFGCSALAHLSVSIFLVIYCFVIMLLYFIKYKKLPFDMNSWKHYLVIIIMFFVLTAVMYPIYYSGFGAIVPDTKLSSRFTDIGSLFKWVDVPENNFTLNPVYSLYESIYIGKWTLLLLFLGIFFLLITKKDKNFVLLSGLITIYMIYHLHVFGIVEEGDYRIGRYMMIEVYFFYAIMAVGIVNLPNLLPINKKSKMYAKYFLSLVFIILLVSTQGTKAYDTLKNSYTGVLRINPAQYELTQWVEQNVPENASLNLFGTITYPKQRWMQILSRHWMSVDQYELAIGEKVTKIEGWPDIVNPVTHMIFDYSDFIMIGAQDSIASLQQSERQFSENMTLVYDKNYIRVYKFD